MQTAEEQPVLYTKRLILRHWREDDAGALFLWAKDPTVAYPAGWMPHTDVGYSLAVIRTIFAPRGSFAIVRKEEGHTPIGSISLQRKESPAGVLLEGEIGYWLGKDWWNRGYATEALEEICRYGFETCGMRRLWCSYHDGNERSRHVMEKCGFIYDHTDGAHYNPLLKEHFILHLMKKEKNYICV